ncbi:MAG: hypothetical protein ACI80V_001356 [Rhodothermales bacterium]|jgi:hypothetical protein
MRHAFFVACMLLLVFGTAPASAQLRTEATHIDAPVRLYDTGGSGFSLNKYFSPAHFQMSHSIEMSSSSYGGSLGMYTNSMAWQFSDKLAARVDVAMAYAPGGEGSTTGMLSNNALNGQGGRIFLRNAEVAYRPTENSIIQFSIQQNPYGNHMSPYGQYGSPYGYNRYDQSGFGGRYGYNRGSGASLFWKSNTGGK